LTARLEKTVLSEKMIKNNLSRVEDSATKSTYKLWVGFERCEKKDEKSAPKFVPTSSYHKEEETLKPTKTHYPSNLKPSFNPKEAFVCMFCGRAGHLDEFFFRRKRIERRCFEYTENSYHDEFFNFPPLSYSRASPHTSSRALPRVSNRPNHRHMAFVHERTYLCLDFGYDPRSHRGDCFPRRLGFSTRASHTHFEPKHLNGPRFSRCGSCPTRSSE
jgi:hypothetical protein